MKWKINFMFETTNQILYYHSIHKLCISSSPNQSTPKRIREPRHNKAEEQRRFQHRTLCLQSHTTWKAVLLPVASG